MSTSAKDLKTDPANKRADTKVFVSPTGTIISGHQRLKAAQQLGVPIEFEVVPSAEYLSPSSDEVYQWHREGLCVWCGGKCPGDQCRLRNCTSCTQLWIADTLTDVHDGYAVTKEYCLPCQVWMDSYHAVNPAKPTHMLCGSIIEPDIKIAGQQWKGWCIWPHCNRQDFFVTASTIDEAASLIIRAAGKVAPRPLFQGLVRHDKQPVTCSECLPLWENLHLQNPALSPAPGDSIVGVGSKPESTAEQVLELGTPYAIRLSGADAQLYHTATWRRSALQSIAQQTASEQECDVVIVGPTGDVLFRVKQGGPRS